MRPPTWGLVGALSLYRHADQRRCRFAKRVDHGRQTWSYKRKASRRKIQVAPVMNRCSEAQATLFFSAAPPQPREMPSIVTIVAIVPIEEDLEKPNHPTNGVVRVDDTLLIG